MNKSSRNLYELAALVGFVTVIGLCITYTTLTWMNLEDLRHAVKDARGTLAQLQARAAGATGARAAARKVEPEGNAFLDGETITVAGARLQARVVSAIAKANGTVTSSQIDLQDGKSPASHVRLTSDFEIDSANLQPLFYDLEAGMPFLYIDDLQVSAPASAEAENRQMRVSMTVSGYWREVKS